MLFYLIENAKPVIEETCAPTKPLHFSCVFVLHGLACVVERPGLCLRRLHILSRVMGLLFMFFACLAPCICLCLSDPPVTPSPASRPPTPYQTRERTRDARMYHSHQFCFGFTAAGWWGRVSLCLLEYSVMQFRGKSYFASHFQHIWGNPTTCDRIHFAVLHVAFCEIVLNLIFVFPLPGFPCQ